MSSTVRERHVKAGELAEIMGVSEKTIRRFDAAGMPSETWGMSRTKRFLPSACIAWARERPATVNGTPRRFTVADRRD